MHCSDSISTLLLTHRPAQPAGLAVGLIAEIAGTSTRSLQRHLQMSGLNYRELLERARYDAAIQLLARTDEAIMDITRKLGYSEPTHFARAFRRMAGVSPGGYLRQIQN